MGSNAITNNIDDSGSPCSTPRSIGNGLDTCPLIIILEIFLVYVGRMV